MTETRAGEIITFYSYKGGTGRTMALANVAWILAANGKRVLVADWDLESPGLHRFFKPFLNADAISGTGGIIDMIRAYEWETTRKTERPDGWVEEYAKVQRYAFSLRWDFPGAGSLDFLSAGRQNGDYAVSVSGLDWDTFYDRLGGGQFFDAVRADMKRNYDYTLIDSRTGLSDVANICTIHLPDTLVDCFTLSDQGIDGAAQVALDVQGRYSARNARQRPIRILPVPMRVDQGEKEKADAGRKLAVRRFPDLPTGMTEGDRRRYWAVVEVPYRPFYAYEETLATFGDTPGSPTSLLSAYENLTAVITAGAVSSLPPMDDAVRVREKARFERKPEVVEEEIVLRYAPEDQVWAEWVDRVLVSAGVRVTDPRTADRPTEGVGPLASRTLTIVSPAYAATETGVLPPRDHAGSRPPVGVYIADLRPLPEFPTETSVSVAGLSATAAGERVLRLVGRPGQVAGDDPPGAGARFPGSDPDVFSAPARNARFTGRDDDLRQLRAQLRYGGTAVVLPVALQGMGGVGKTQVALEYVHRFKAAYDIVWWIQSEQVQFIDGAMADLGTNIGVATNVGGPTEPTAVDIARATLQALRRGEPSERWLVVFDNAEDLDKVGEFLPKGGGHVLITSRNGAWSDRAHPIQVDVFRRHESVAHLRRRVETVSEEEANQIAEALGDLPIAVAAAGAWLAETGTPVADYLGQIERHSSQAVEATWDLSLNRLLGQSPAAYRLLQLCSVLAPEIALELLYSDEMAAALTPLDPSVSERVMRGALVQQINRLALLKLDVHAGQVQVHRLLQNVVRDRMSAADLEEARHQVHLMLAASRPRGEVDDPDTWRRFRMLWPHLQISGAVDCLDEKVRQLLIDRVRYLWRRGDLPQGEELGLDIAAAWATLLETGSDSAESESLHRQLLHLRFNVANILREQARFEEARSLDEEVLDSQRKLLGPRHPHTLMTSGSLAADLRALGRYAEALPMEDVTYRAWSEGFGEDHPRTLAALNNLAAAYRAVGNFRDARSRDQDAHERRRVVLGPTHPYTLHSASCLGRDLREAGEYEKSVTLLRSIFDAFREELGPDAAGSLNAQANLAVSLRSAGRAGEAAPLLEEAYERLNDRFGPSSSETVSCRLSRSANLLVAGDTEWATREMQAVTKAYEDSLGATHPHTLVCVSNLSAAARASGDHKRARELAEQASTGFRRTLGLDHPYTLAATMNVASCLVEDGDLARARRPMQEMATQMGKTLGPEHPDTLCCESNLAITLRKLGETGPAADDTLVLDRLAGTIGASHPAVTELREQRLVHRVLDPHPF